MRFIQMTKKSMTTDPTMMKKMTITPPTFFIIPGVGLAKQIQGLVESHNDCRMLDMSIMQMNLVSDGVTCSRNLFVLLFLML